MARNNIFSFFIGLFCLSFIRTDCVSGDGVLVQVEQGWLSGKVLQAAHVNTSYYSFKGIPYAKPPVGELRFKDPQPPISWEGVRNATEHGAICPQVNLLVNTYIPGSEDCLFLNVYSPKLSNDSLLPVLVYVYGGVFKFGSGNVDNYGPDLLMNKTRDIVVVTFNYRTDSLGLLSFNEDVPGNAGLKDQVFALRWVQQNINQFGGDPNHVTLMGESSGAASVSLHVLSPMSKGLFHRAIMQSGVALCDWVNPYYADERGFALAQDLGFKTRNVSQAIAFLRNTTTDKLVNSTSTVLASEVQTEYFAKIIPFTPVVEKDYGQERFMVEKPMEALKAGHINVDTVLITYTDREAITFISFIEVFMTGFNRYKEMFVPNKIIEKSNSSTVLKLADKIIDYYYADKEVSLANMEEFINFNSNFSFVYDTHRFMRKLRDNNVNVYFGKIGAQSERNYYATALGAAYNISGTAHLDDTLYLFNAESLNLTLAENSTAYQLVSAFTTLWSNFVKYGNPTPDSSLGFVWPKYEKESLQYLDIGNNITVSAGADETDVQFWKGILEIAGISF